jgi:hypothetical protein
LAVQVTEQFWLQATEQDGSLHVEWDNRRATRNHMHTGCMAFLGLFFAPLGLLAACVAFGVVGSAPWYGRVFAALWAGIGLLVSIGTAYKFLARRWVEWIEITPTAVTHGHRGLLAWKHATFLIGPRSELSVGRFEDDGRDTLGLTWLSSWGSRYRAEFGEWLAVPAKEQVFLVVAKFVEAQKIPLALKRYYR